MFAIIQAAGWPIWPLLVTSVIAVALIIERLVMLRKERIVPEGLLGKAVAAYEKEGVNKEPPAWHKTPRWAASSLRA